MQSCILPGFLPGFPLRATFSCLLFLLPSYTVGIFRGALLTLPLVHIFCFYPSVDLIHSCGLSSSRDWQPSNIPPLQISTLPPFSPLTDTTILNVRLELHAYPTQPHSSRCPALQDEYFTQLQMKALRQSSHKICIFALFIPHVFFLIIYSDILKCILKNRKKLLSENENFSLDLYSNKEMKQDMKKQ